MNAGLIILHVAAERRDAQNERDGARAVQLRRSSDSVAAAAPSQQHYNLALNWSSHRRVPPRGAAGTSRRDASCAQHQLRRSSISSVAAASAPSQQHQQATAVSRDDERSTGFF